MTSLGEAVLIWGWKSTTAAGAQDTDIAAIESVRNKKDFNMMV